MDASSAEATGGQLSPPPQEQPQTETANAVGGDPTPPVPPPPQTGTAGTAAAQPQPQRPTEAKGDEPPPPPPATGAEEVAGEPQQPTATTPASKPPAPPEPQRPTEAKKGDEPPPPPATGEKEVAGHGQPPPPSTSASKPPAPPEPQRPTELKGGEPPPPPRTPASEPPAPPEPTQQQQQSGDAAKHSPDGDGGKKKPEHSRWQLFRNKLSPHAPPPRGDVASTSAGAGDALKKPQKEEEEEEGKGEGSKKSGPDEAKAPRCLRLAEKIKSLMRTESGGGAVEEGGGTPVSTPPAAEAKAPPSSPDDDAASPRRSLQKIFKKVLLAVQVIRRLKPRRKTGNQAEDGKGKEKQKPEQPEEEEEKPPEPGNGEEKPAAQPEKEKEEKLHPRWKKLEEVRLQGILEEAFTKLLKGEFDELNEQWRWCLLTFSVFPVDHHVKKQAVTYWWDAQSDLQPSPGDETKHLGAKEIFGKLCDSGFLEPIKNRCSKVSHGCRVNPLVHWMVKRKAREGSFADLDDRGDPADRQPKSAVLCLTESHRERLQSIDRSNEPSSPKKPGPSPTRTPSKGPQEKKLGPSQTPSREGRQQKENDPTRTPSKGRQQTSGQAEEQQNENDKTKFSLLEFQYKTVILNINAHVYRLPNCLLSNLGDRLLVLQLGRWWNSDDSTYMEVEGLEKLSTIGNLRNLRYLSFRGLAKLTELPKEVNKLQQLKVLDVRGCQNLTRVMSSTIKTLRKLTHLDLTECYMLEHIGREITDLSELQVFKGFVFGVDAPLSINMFHWQDRHVCRLQDLKTKMKKLQKLSINVTTDANVDEKEMAQLKHLESLQSLTITWGELPSILTSDKRSKNKDQLLNRWTGLVLPPNLEKLDVRCYPREEIPLKWFGQNKKCDTTKLKKLYVRGGAVEKLELPKENNVEILRLRYLKKFNMKWAKMFLMMKNLRYVEVVDKDDKVYQRGNELQPHMVKQGKKIKKVEEKLMEDIKNNMSIPKFTLDEQGVWECDQNKKSEGFKGDIDGNVPESTQALRKVPQNDGHATKATTNDEVTDVSSDSNMVEKGTQAPSVEQPKNDNLETRAITNRDVGIPRVSQDVENARSDGIQAPNTELTKNDTHETGIVANHNTLSAPKVSLKKVTNEQNEKQVGGPKALLSSNEKSTAEHSKSSTPNEQSSRENDAFDTSSEQRAVEGKVSDTFGEQCSE